MVLRSEAARLGFSFLVPEPTLSRDDRDAGSGFIVKVKKKNCHPVMLLYGISLLPDSRLQIPLNPVMLNLFQHPGGPYESITFRHSELDSESRCSLVDVSNELTSSPFRKRSSSYNLHLGTCNRSFLRTENRSTINQFLLLLQTPYLLPRFLISPDPGSSPG